MKLTVDELYVEILMLRNIDRTLTILLVEGGSDAGALDGHLIEDGLMPIPAHGKQTVLGAVSLSDLNNIPGVLAILDRDWDGNLVNKSPSSNVSYTDHYDIDATAFFFGTVARRVIANFANISLVKQHIAALGASSPAEALASACAKIGLLRFTSAKYGHGISMRNFPIKEVLDHETLQVDEDRLIQVAMARSPDATVYKDTLTAQYRAEVGLADKDIRYYCSGHDLLAALSFVSSKKWGGDGGAKNIGRAIRAAFGVDDLIQTSLYRQVTVWEQSTGFRVWSANSSSGDVVSSD